MQYSEDSKKNTSLSTPVSSDSSELDAEQRYLTMLYERLDALRERARNRLGDVLITPPAANDQGISERDDLARTHRSRGMQLDAVERGLCFGRIDLDDEQPDDSLYIGRLGLMSEDYDPVLIDWRTPAAEPFYRATYADRMGVVRRRHIHTRGRSVVRLDDDVLDLESVTDNDRSHLMGEGALLASLEAGRTGRMSDIVPTIQAEQDAIIRSEPDGILVVEGGPGTGKTVVALHRAAYLLYNYRHRFARRGVLVLGPNPTFMRYIDQVLPSLGETDVVMATLGELFPGVATARQDPEPAAVPKGDLRMVSVIRRAVELLQYAPPDGIGVRVNGDFYHLDHQTCVRARDRARDTGLVHNRARRYLVDSVLQELTEQSLDRIGREYAGLFDPGSVRGEFSQDPAVHRILDELWPELSPAGLLARLYSDPDFLAAAAPELDDSERAALIRTNPYEWTVGDVPLLDEIALLVGPTDLAVHTAAEAERQAETEAADAEKYARTISMEAAEAEWSADEDKPFVVADSELIAERYSERALDGSIADRALLDREWEFGYAIVDEAQEMSAMAWRLVMRRVPGRSMTVVGDVAQTSSASGADSWAAALDPFAAGEWRRATLSINYRTPEPVMRLAADVLASTTPDAVAPRPVRDGDEPWVRPLESMRELRDAVLDERDRIGEGKVAVITAAERIGDVLDALRWSIPDLALGGSVRALDAAVTVLTPSQSKGLEFDAVIVLDPAAILGVGPEHGAGAGEGTDDRSGDGRARRGSADLYVALTRATRRLGVLYPGGLPVALERLQSR